MGIVIITAAELEAARRLARQREIKGTDVRFHRGAKSKVHRSAKDKARKDRRTWKRELGDQRENRL